MSRQSVARLVVLAAVLIPIALQTSAQNAIFNGACVTLTGASGKQLSAAQPETLALSENSSGWEQWIYMTAPQTVLMSFHSTALIMEYPQRKAYHSAVRPGESFVIHRAVPSSGGRFEIAAGPPLGGGWAVICVNPYDGCLAESGGMLGVQGFQSTSIPPEAVWKLTVVNNRVPGARALKWAAIDGTSYDLKSKSFNTFVALNSLPDSGPLAATHTAAPPVYHPYISIGGHKNPSAGMPLRYGDSIQVMWMPQTLPYFLKTGGGQQEGMETARVSVGVDEPWLIVPVPPYQNGNRLAINGPMILRSSKGTHLSATPSVPTLRLSPNASGWETWYLERR